MWLKLLRANNLEKLLTPSIKDGRYQKAAISGRRRKELKGYFLRAGLPWIYDEPKDRTKHVYNKAPKGSKKDRTHHI